EERLASTRRRAVAVDEMADGDAKGVHGRKSRSRGRAATTAGASRHGRRAVAAASVEEHEAVQELAEVGVGPGDARRGDDVNAPVVHEQDGLGDAGRIV